MATSSVRPRSGGNASSRRHRSAPSRRRNLALAGAVAAFAGAAIFNINRARRAERVHPPAGKFVEVDGVRLHYVERGEGRPLILLHGNGASIGDMEASGVLDRAARHYRVLAFDRPGYGHSSRPRSMDWTPEEQATLLWVALRGMGIARPILLGHSWGTLVALAMALEHPGDVAALVLLSGYYFPTARPDAFLFSPPAIPVIGDALRYTLSPPLARLLAPAFVRRIFSPAKVPASFERFPLELSMRPGQLRASAAETAMMIAGAARLSRRYGELDLPVMILSGDGDKITDPEGQSRRLHELLKGSELRIVPGAGHMIHYFAPDLVLAAIDTAAERTQTIEPASDLADAPVPVGGGAP